MMGPGCAIDVVDAQLGKQMEDLSYTAGTAYDQELRTLRNK